MSRRRYNVARIGLYVMPFKIGRASRIPMPKVNSDPDPSPSDSSHSSSLSDSARKRKKVKIRKSVVSIEKMTRQTRPRVMTLMNLIRLRTVIIDVDDAKIRNIGKRNQSDYAQL